jgi:hypothetical protein
VLLHVTIQPVAGVACLVRAESAERGDEIVRAKMASIGSARLSVLGTRAGITRRSHPMTRRTNPSVPRQNNVPLTYERLPPNSAINRTYAVVVWSTSLLSNKIARPPTEAATPPVTMRRKIFVYSGQRSGLARNANNVMMMNKKYAAKSIFRRYEPMTTATMAFTAEV